jgi:hypothetical protein
MRQESIVYILMTLVDVESVIKRTFQHAMLNKQ